MGFLDIIAYPFSYVFQFGYWLVSKIGGGYAAALLLFALFVKLFLLPLSIKQQKNQIKTAKLRPQIFAIEKKYAGRTDKVTQQKKQQEIFDLQSQAGASPMAGCLPLLIQLPIIIALYEIVRKPLTWLCRFSSDVILKLNDLINHPEEPLTSIKTIDQILLSQKVSEAYAADPSAFAAIEGFDITKLPKLTLLGQTLGVEPAFSPFNWLTLIPFLVFASSWLSMWIMKRVMKGTQPAQTPDQQVSAKIMDLVMPFMSLIFAFNFSAALGLYWIYQSLITVLQTVILAKLMPLPKFSDEELKAMEKEIRKNKGVSYDRETCRDSNRPVKSLHYIDEDDDDVPAPKAKSTPKDNPNRPELKK